ncbi:MAG: MoaD family protein [Planctomycetes bacterium]|nr:MoaD family protein [Planctomycetota bacterium]
MATTLPEVRVIIPSELRSLAGDDTEFRIAAGDVRWLLNELARQHPQVHVRLCDEQGEPRPHINVFLNDHCLARSELNAPLAAGDVVTILPAVSGG